jgi:glycosyltransferase involved in cell wall biosynthesis
VPLDLLILTSYFAIEPRSIRGGVGYRYVGFYGSLVRTLLKHSPNSAIFWYSTNDRYMRIRGRKQGKLRAGIIGAVLKATLESLRNGSHLMVIIAYPYAVPSFKRIFEYVSCLLVLRILRSAGVIVVVDMFDPPVETAYAFSVKRPSFPLVLYYRILDAVSARLATLVVAISESFRCHIERTYRLGHSKTLVVPSGCLISHINYVPPSPQGGFVVLYAGSAMSVKDVDRLVSAVQNLRQRGLNMQLHIAGAKLMDLPEWVDTRTADWPTFLKDILERADVGVIPYPPERLLFHYCMPAKTFDYMAAGKPVVSTNLKEIGNVIRTHDCGLVARDWGQFQNYLERLYRDRQYATSLGKNGRKAAEMFFDYNVLARVFLDTVLSRLKRDSHQGLP